jgi:hypothetical protein
MSYFLNLDKTLRRQRCGCCEKPRRRAATRKVNATRRAKLFIQIEHHFHGARALERIDERTLKTRLHEALGDTRNKVVGQVRQSDENTINLSTQFDNVADRIVRFVTVGQFGDAAACFHARDVCGVDTVRVMDIATRIGNGNQRHFGFTFDYLCGGFTQPARA